MKIKRISFNLAYVLELFPFLFLLFFIDEEEIIFQHKNYEFKPNSQKRNWFF